MEVNRPEWEKYPGGDKRIEGRWGRYDGDVNGDGDGDGMGMGMKVPANTFN